MRQREPERGVRHPEAAHDLDERRTDRDRGDHARDKCGDDEYPTARCAEPRDRIGGGHGENERERSRDDRRHHAVDQRGRHTLTSERGYVVLQSQYLGEHARRHCDRIERRLEGREKKIDERKAVEDDRGRKKKPEDDAAASAGFKWIHRALLPGRQMRVIAAMATASITTR